MKNNKLPIKSISTKAGANAFVFGLVFNQTIKSEQSFIAPYLLQERLGSLDIEMLSKMEIDMLETVILQQPAIHPFSHMMAKNIIITSQILEKNYKSDSRNIWKTTTSIGEIQQRLNSLAGIGKHKALIGLFLLMEHFHILPPDKNIKTEIMNSCPGLFVRYEK